MHLRQHLAKLSWAAFDKMLFILFGVVTLLQIRALSPEEWGLASQLVTLQTWIFIVTDGSALQAIIQFGVDERERGKANLLSLILHSAISMAMALVVLFAQQPLAQIFNEPRFASVAMNLPFFCLLTIPRAFCLKLMQRDLQMREIFFTNLAWFGTMAAYSLWLLRTDALHRYEDVVGISLTGISVSSLVAVLLAWPNIKFQKLGTVSLIQVLRFVFPQAFVAALNNSIRQLDVFLVQPFFGTAAAGVYNSAKMLYRIFETITDAGIALMYPTAVKLLAVGEREKVIAVFSKAISLLLAVTVIAVLVLESGGTELIVSFLGPKYVAAAAQFNVMLIGALFLPFFVLQSVELAQHKVNSLLLMVALSVGIGALTFIVTGILQLQWLAPLGVVSYSLSFSLMLLYSVRRDLPFGLKDLFRIVPDVRAALRTSELRRNSD